MSFRLANLPSADGSARAVLVRDHEWHDVATMASRPDLADPMAALAEPELLHRLDAELGSRAPDGALDVAALGPVVPRPASVFGIGLNYRSHAEETGAPLPVKPLTFAKFSSCLAAPTGRIEIRGAMVDWEVELVVVIGRGGRDIPVADAWAHVAGLTLGQDISDRLVQFEGQPPQWSLGKSFDGYGPVGPVLCSVDLFTDPDDVGITCSLDGEVVQDGRTSDLIFPVPELVAYLSSICTLRPGDLIFTGTPSGVGVATNRFLTDGQLLESSAEVIGSMSHRIVQA